MKNFNKREYYSPDGSFLKNHDVSKKHKADLLAYENQSSIDWHEVKIILDATVVEKYLNNRKSESKISPSYREKILVQKIPRVNQDVFSGKNNVMVKLEIPEEIRVDANLSPEDRLAFDDAPVKQEDCISVLDTDTLDNDTFHDGVLAESLCEDFECRDNDKHESVTVEAGLKNEVVELESFHEEVTVSQEFKDALKNEEVFVGQEFKHEESIPSYENVESNNEELIKKSTRSNRKRKKCLDCDDCSHGLAKKPRPALHDKVVTSKLPVKEPKTWTLLDTDTLDNDRFHDGEFAESLHEDFECRYNDNHESVAVEAALKNEVVESCHEEVSFGQEFKDAFKNEELFVGQEFKHEESIRSYENVESINEENNEESIKKSTRSSRKRKKCLDCDDCSHGLAKKPRPLWPNKVVTPKLPIQDPKTCSDKSQTPSKPSKSKSSLRAKEQKTNQESSNKPQSRKSEYRVHHCDHCDYKGRRAHLISHFRNKHPYLFPNDSVRCPNCEMKFNSWEEMQRHRPVCLLFLICKFCLVNVPSKHAMVRHMKAVHPEKICGKKGERIIDKVCLNSMTGAMKTMEMTPFGQRYAEIRNYYSEMESELIKLYCPKCDVTQDKIIRKKTTRCDSCESRLLFQCQKCKVTRSHYTDIWKHLMSKSSDCSISENLSFMDDEESSNAANQAPTASSSEPKRQDCEICDFKGTTRTQLYEHVLNVHLDNGIIKTGHYTCSKCGASFRVGNVRLKRHRELCGIAVRFPCRFCPMTCITMRHLSDHIVTMHLDVLDGRDINEFLKEVLDFKRMVKEVNRQRFNDKLRNGKAETERNYYHNGIQSMLKPVCIECKTDGPQKHEYCANCQASLNFVCLKCDELFSKYSAAWVHATRMCENRSFTLTVEKTCNDPAKVDVSTMNKELLYCDHCSFKNANKAILCKHTKHAHRESHQIRDGFTCPKCYRTFANSRYLYQHRLRCRAGFYYTCHFCDKTSSKFDVIENHIKNKHANRVRCKDTLDEILQMVVENKRAPQMKFDKFGRMIRRTFSENIKLATFHCPNCDESVHKNFLLVADTRKCPKCNGELRVYCKVCNKGYSKWESITYHFQIKKCGGVKIDKEPRIETYEVDHSYSLRQLPPEVTHSSAARG